MLARTYARLGSCAIREAITCQKGCRTTPQERSPTWLIDSQETASEEELEASGFRSRGAEAEVLPINLPAAAHGAVLAPAQRKPHLMAQTFFQRLKELGLFFNVFHVSPEWERQGTSQLVAG